MSTHMSCKLLIYKDLRVSTKMGRENPGYAWKMGRKRPFSSHIGLNYGLTLSINGLNGMSELTGLSLFDRLVINGGSTVRAAFPIGSCDGVKEVESGGAPYA